jgi:lipopolysaccharide transport system permease protein/teichoic acid transport system permease protein
VYWLQILYYLIASTVFLLGITWATASISLFIKDIQNITGIIVRIGFYGTPIFWSISMIPDKYRILFKLNPAYYIVEGYRDSLIYGKGFWQEPWMALYFWGITAAALIFGIFIYRKLRPHFADVV